MAGRFTHVFFDFTDTMVRVRGSVGAIYADVARRHGLDVPATAIDDHFSGAIDAIPQPVEPGLSVQAMAARERQWWRDVAALAMKPLGDFPEFEAFFDEIFQVFGHAEAWDALPGLQQTLDALRKDGLRLGVISDMDARLHDVLDALGLGDHFEIVCLSFRIGYSKPDRRLYDAAIQRANTAASQCVHVGDSVAKDIQPALAAGMLAIHLAENHNDTPDRAHRIRALTELPTLLHRLERGDSLATRWR